MRMKNGDSAGLSCFKHRAWVTMPFDPPRRHPDISAFLSVTKVAIFRHVSEPRRRASVMRSGSPLRGRFCASTAGIQPGGGASPTALRHGASGISGARVKKLRNSAAHGGGSSTRITDRILDSLVIPAAAPDNRSPCGGPNGTSTNAP